jgi:hypothetical protein
MAPCGRAPTPSAQMTHSGQIMPRLTCATSPYSSRRRGSVFEQYQAGHRAIRRVGGDVDLHGESIFETYALDAEIKTQQHQPHGGF